MEFAKIMRKIEQEKLKTDLLVLPVHLVDCDLEDDSLRQSRKDFKGWQGFILLDVEHAGVVEILASFVEHLGVLSEVGGEHVLRGLLVEVDMLFVSNIHPGTLAAEEVVHVLVSRFGFANFLHDEFFLASLKKKKK